MQPRSSGNSGSAAKQRRLPAQAVPPGLIAATQNAHTGDAIDAQWLHELRNAVNTASIAVLLARRALESCKVEGVPALLEELERACSACSALLHRPVGARLS